VGSIDRCDRVVDTGIGDGGDRQPGGRVHDLEAAIARGLNSFAPT
jgi:hypothetical protein